MITSAMKNLTLLLYVIETELKRIMLFLETIACYRVFEGNSNVCKSGLQASITDLEPTQGADPGWQITSEHVVASVKKR